MTLQSPMAPDVEQATEHSSLLPHDRRFSTLQHEDAHSILSSHVTKEERALGSTAVGERLPYNDYTTIDWLHDKVCKELPLRDIKCSDPFPRSRNRSGSDWSTPNRVCDTVSWLPLTIVRNGSLLPSSAS